MNLFQKIQSYKKLLFVFFPKNWLIISLFGTVVICFDNFYAQFGYMALNLGLCIFSVRLAILIHEIGHWLGARLVGEYPRRIVLGIGHSVLRTYFFKTKLNIFTKLQSGHVITIFTNRKNYRLRRGIYSIMGPLANLLMAIVFFTIFPITMDFGNTICAAYLGGLVNILICIGNLYPKKGQMNGIEYKSDGLQLWNLITSKGTDVEEDDGLMNDFLDAEDAIQEKDYQKAIDLFESLVAQFENKSLMYYACMLNIGVCMLNIGVCKGELGDVEGFYEVTKLVEEELGSEIPTPFIGPIYNNLALTSLLKNNLTDAENYIRLALKQAHDRPEVIILLGAIYIEKGEYSRGIERLKPEVDFSYPNGNTLLAAMYLVMAYQLTEKETEAQLYRKFITQNEASLTPLEKQIWQRVRERKLYYSFDTLTKLPL